MNFQSKKIILREYQKLDWKRVHTYASLEDFSKYDAWGPNSESDTIGFIDRMIKSSIQIPRIEFNFAIISKEENLLIGGCSLRKEGERSSIGSLGYAVNPDNQGRGIATEATELLLKYGFKHLKLSVIYASCDIDNIGSYKVMEKCRMYRVGEYKAKREFKGRISDEYRYEITKEEYFKNL